VFTLLDLVQPDTLDEAYKILTSRRNNVILGGCAFLRMGSQRIGTGVELSKLNLNYITEQAGCIEIGASTTFRDIETSPVLNECFNGILPKAVSNIIGVQFRNVVTVGASVFSKYGFSDFITALLSLDTEVELYKGGRMPLQEFLDKPYTKDILTRIFIAKNDRKADYQSLRNSASDYPILNAAVSILDGQWTVVVGARPSRAKIARQTSLALSDGNVCADNIDFMAHIAPE